MSRKLLFRCLSISLSVLIFLFTVTAYGSTASVYLGSDENGINVFKDVLKPGREYIFPVLMSVEGSHPIHLTEKDGDLYKLTVRTDESFLKAEPVVSEGMVYLKVNPADKAQTALKEVKIIAEVSQGRDRLTVPIRVNVGFGSLSGENLERGENNGIVYVTNESPIINKEDMERIAAGNNYGEVIFVGSRWSYAVNLREPTGVNLYCDGIADKNITKWNKDANIYFMSFYGEPNFKEKGTLTINAEDIIKDIGKDFYMYRFAYNKLFPLGYTVDEEENTIVIHPSCLSKYVISDKPLIYS